MGQYQVIRVHYSCGPIHIWATFSIRGGYRGSDRVRGRDWVKGSDWGRARDWV